jgi:hypothetical protein
MQISAHSDINQDEICRESSSIDASIAGQNEVASTKPTTTKPTTIEQKLYKKKTLTFPAMQMFFPCMQYIHNHANMLYTKYYWGLAKVDAPYLCMCWRVMDLDKTIGFSFKISL